jgi:hypothetical protein
VLIGDRWSDGMDNKTSNSFSKCQLKFLQRCIDRLNTLQRPENQHQNAIGPLILRPRPQKPKGGDPMPTVAGFWINTLCVPVREEDYEWRKKSISRMRRIYAEAYRVLVLDAGVRQLHSRDSSLNTKGAVLALYNWQRRLWTWQKGILAQNLFFQPQDEVESVYEMTKMEGGIEEKGEVKESIEVGDEEWEDERRRPKANTRLESYQRFGTRLLMTVPMLGLKSDPLKRDSEIVSRFPVTLPPLESRTTTRKSDETVCFATLLDLDPAPLLDIRSRQFAGNLASTRTSREAKETKMAEEEKKRLEEQRKELAEAWVCTEWMAPFLRMLKTLPSILPFNTYSRLPKPGYRWIPRTYLDLHGPGDGKGTLHPNGIQSVTLDHLAGARIASETGGLMVKFSEVIFRLEIEDLPLLPMLILQPQRQQQHGQQRRAEQSFFGETENCSLNHQGPP